MFRRKKRANPSNDAKPRRSRIEALRPLLLVSCAALGGVIWFNSSHEPVLTADGAAQDARNQLDGLGYRWASVRINGDVAEISGAAPGELERVVAYDVVHKAMRPIMRGERLIARVESHLSLGPAAIDGQPPAEQIAAVAAKPGVEPIAEKPVEPAPAVQTIAAAVAADPVATQAHDAVAKPAPELTVVSVDAAAAPVVMPAIAKPSAIETSAINQPSAPVQADCAGEFADVMSETTIVFGIDSADIDPKSAPVLDALAAIAKRCSRFHVTVEGHTDITGRTDHNRALSQRRADAVRAALIMRGVSEGGLASKGFGASRPIAHGSTEADYAKNRRIHFTVRDAAQSAVQVESSATR